MGVPDRSGECLTDPAHLYCGIVLCVSRCGAYRVDTPQGMEYCLGLQWDIRQEISAHPILRSLDIDSKPSIEPLPQCVTFDCTLCLDRQVLGKIKLRSLSKALTRSNIVVTRCTSWLKRRFPPMRFAVGPNIRIPHMNNHINAHVNYAINSSFLV